MSMLCGLGILTGVCEPAGQWRAGSRPVKAESPACLSFYGDVLRKSSLGDILYKSVKADICTTHHSNDGLPWTIQSNWRTS